MFAAYGERMNASARAARPLIDDCGDPVHGAPACTDLAGKRAEPDIIVNADDVARMNEVVAAVCEVVETPMYQEAALAGAPEIARRLPQRVTGLFSGFDFHLTKDGPKLIEINTNAGGAFFGALLDHAAWREGDLRAHPQDYWADRFVGHIRNEWQKAGRGSLATVAIVDDAPGEQFLRLEFQLAARMLKEAGITAVIADPGALSFRDGRLWHGATAIDFVYNRLTSFALDRDVDRALRESLLDGAVVVSPDPRNHALLACKQNLIRLCNADFLRDAGVCARTRDILLEAVPATVAVTREAELALWQSRAGYYFKPSSGFGSRAVYDGAKLTAKTWAQIVADGGYVAQRRIEPPRVDVNGVSMRYDVRTFAYGREPFMRLARVYRGQTTNFRTPGGGFAPVRVVA
jgi:hypothetical protein